MVVLKDADAHSLVCRYFLELGDVDIVEIFHPDRFLVGSVCSGRLDRELDSSFPEFVYRLIGKTAASVAPKADAYIKFGEVVGSYIVGHGVKQEIHILLPREPFGATDGSPSHSGGLTVYAGEVNAIHSADHTTPSVGIDDPVQLKLCDGF